MVSTLKSDYLTQGPKVREFESKFAEYVGAEYAVAVNNATSGLHISVLALNLSKGDRVITTPITFAATQTVFDMQEQRFGLQILTPIRIY